MFVLYQRTEMEKRIEYLYKVKNILSPNDLNIVNVAQSFDVEIDFSLKDGPELAIWDENTSVIFLNPEQPEVKQREVFFHELCHPLMHYGDQSIMKNKTFRDLQEFQANQFQLYAAVPFFILEKLELPKYEYQVIHLIETVFKVPYSLAMKRFEQIKRRIFQSQVDRGLIVQDSPGEQFQDNTNSFPLLDDLFSPKEIRQYKFKRPNRKNSKVYYDYTNGEMVPVWYCIEVNRGEINWSKNLKFFPIDAPFKLVPVNEFEHRDSDAAIFNAELTLHHSKPNDFGIDLKLLKRKLAFFDVDPYNIKRLIINVQDLEQFLQLIMVSDSVKEKSKEMPAAFDC